MSASKIEQMLFDALAVLLLSDGTRHAIEGTDPKAFEQALVALNAADPRFGERLSDARERVRLRREKSLQKRGGAYTVKAVDELRALNPNLLKLLEACDEEELP